MKKIREFLSWKNIFIAFLIIVFVGFIYNQITKGTKKRLTAKILRQDISDAVIVSGNVLANGQTPIYSSTTGIITTLYVSNNQPITVGQMIASIKSTASEMEKKKAYADYTSALNKKNNDITNKTTLQSQLETGRQTVINAAEAINKMEDNRNNGRKNPTTGKDYTQNEIDSLYSALTSSRQNFSALEKNFNNADAAINSSTNSVAAFYSAYQATQDSAITSPINGIVANIAYTTGDKVTASAVEQGAQTVPLLLIIGYAKPTIKAKINEANVASIIPGQRAKVTLDALPDKKYNAIVDRLDTVGTNTEGVITYNVYLTIMSDDSSIRPGMTANVNITTNTKNKALVVPNEALLLREAGSFVAVYKNNSIIEVPVKIGIRSGKNSEILSGLQENDEVVLNSI